MLQWVWNLDIGAQTAINLDFVFGVVRKSEMIWWDITFLNGMCLRKRKIGLLLKRMWSLYADCLNAPKSQG